MEFVVTDTEALGAWAAEYAPELIKDEKLDMTALGARLMLDDEDWGGLMDMATGTKVPGIRII